MILAAEFPWAELGPLAGALAVGAGSTFLFLYKPERQRVVDLQDRLDKVQEARLEDAKVNIPVLDRLVVYLDKHDRTPSSRSR